MTIPVVSNFRQCVCVCACVCMCARVCVCVCVYLGIEQWSFLFGKTADPQPIFPAHTSCIHACNCAFLLVFTHVLPISHASLCCSVLWYYSRSPHYRPSRVLTYGHNVISTLEQKQLAWLSFVDVIGGSCMGSGKTLLHVCSEGSPYWIRKMGAKNVNQVWAESGPGARTGVRQKHHPR